MAHLPQPGIILEKPLSFMHLLAPFIVLNQNMIFMSFGPVHLAKFLKTFRVDLEL